MAEHNTDTSARGRVVGLDVARGLLMAYVVIIIHGVFWLQLLPQAPGSILLFEMPAIFMITGAAYFLSEQAKPTTPGVRGYFMFLLKRGVRILTPFAAYALVCAVIMIVVGMARGAPFDTLLAWLNPVRAGAGGHSTLMLNWHLWFIAPFLAVTALLPLLARPLAKLPAPLWLLLAIGAGVSFGVDALGFAYLPKTIVFYTVWALIGFALAARPQAFNVRDCVIALVLSLAAFAALVWASPDVKFNMQANKFPPNGVFFLFCAAWMALWLIAARLIDQRAVARLAGFAPLKPFISAGYSVYLWQGIGYSAAVLLGRQFELHVLVVWAVAIALTVALGLVAAPLERLRIR